MFSVPDRNADWQNVIKANNNNLLSSLHVAMPGVVTAFNSSESFLSVKPTIKDRVIDNKGGVQWADYPLLPHVPFITFSNDPPSVGDACLLIFCDMDISGWWNSGATDYSGVPTTQNQEFIYSHGFNNAVAILGLKLKGPWTSNSNSTSSGSTAISGGTADIGIGVSESLIKFLESWEGFVSGPSDPGAHGVDYWNTTVGYGHVMLKGDNISFPLTQATAETLLKNDLTSQGYVASVANTFSGLHLKQNQIDALVSFAYNLGAHIWGKVNLTADIKAGASADKITADFCACSHVGGAACAGLLRRRQAEAAMFNTAQYIANS